MGEVTRIHLSSIPEMNCTDRVLLGGIIMALEALLMAQNKLFNFPECLRLLTESARTDLSTSISELTLMDIHYRWRALDELELTSELNDLKNTLRQRAETQGNIEFIYLLGRVEAENQCWPEAERNFQRALAEADNSLLKAKSLMGLGVVRYFQENYDEAKALFLKALAESLQRDPYSLENEIVAQLWLAQTSSALRQTDESDHWIESAIRKANDESNFYLLVKGHLILIEIALMNNQLSRAENALLIAQSIVPRQVATKSQRQLKILGEKIAETKGLARFQWIESESRTVLINPHRKACTLSDHPQLLKLLDLLWANPAGLTKEEIFTSLWGPSYHPLHDDNKIYVTIRRLRKIIGDSSDDPCYILRRDSLYVWNREFGFTRFQQRAFAEQESTNYKDNHKGREL